MAAIVVSHFHADHFGGIPLHLLGALYEDERTDPLRIAGPPGIEARVRGLAAAMGHAIEGRQWSFEIHFEELPAGSPLAAPPDRVVYGYELPAGLRVHTGLGVGYERTAAALWDDVAALLQEVSR